MALFFQVWLYAWVTWMTMTLGCAALLYLHHAVRGKWSLVILRTLEAGAKQLLPMMFLGLPVVASVWMGESSIYPWLGELKNHPQVLPKAAYLNPARFTAFYFAYFVIWSFLATRLTNSAATQDKSFDEREQTMRLTFGAWSMVIFMLSMTLAWVDWVMSLDPLWSSTMFPAWFMMGGCLMALSFAAILLTSRMKEEPFNTAASGEVLKDIGNMLLTLTMVWAYFSLSQFLIMWSANIPTEVKYYQSRFDVPALNVMGGILIAFQWLIPFLALLAPRTKKQPALLQKVAILILIMRFVDMFWTVVPFFMAKGKGIDTTTVLVNIAGMVVFGGVWLSLFFSDLRRHSPLPKHDARLEEALSHVQS
ncbi:MAG: hypothetical protein NT023_06125 [Armatimonadetes bacterium]|nr:hypothetical protein [Armatimonadota bacterium]